MTFDENILNRRLRADHFWWESGEIPYYSNHGRRHYYPRFFDKVIESFPHRAVVLMGPRRVGKTVMMYQAIQDLLARKIPASKIFYFSLDTPIYTNVHLETLVEKALSITGNTIEDCYVFFDEIQYLKDWEIHLKSLVDRFRNTKFVVSGSAAAALRMKSTESGAGRFTDFFLPPLTFAEYIDLNGYDGLLKPFTLQDEEGQVFYGCDDMEALNNHFRDYINFGGFPEIALNPEKIKNPEIIIQKDITEKVIMKDLPGLFGIENILELQQFFNVLAYRSGEILNYQSVSQETKMDVKTLKKYITYLESAFLIKVLHRIDVTAKRFKNITQFKIYLTNPSLFTGLFGKVDANDERFPHLVETAVFAQYLHSKHDFLRYASWKSGNSEGEVDLIELNPTFQKAQWALEVKWTDNLKADKLNFFLRKNKMAKGTITSKTLFKNSKDLLIIPNSLHAYKIGKDAFEEFSGV
ncbi:MAG: ATP-binding protein [Bacteroidetes bacterium]|nr:ATP-binding protein [Bacteroidota bacterium]